MNEIENKIKALVGTIEYKESRVKELKEEIKKTKADVRKLERINEELNSMRDVSDNHCERCDCERELGCTCEAA